LDGALVAGGGFMLGAFKLGVADVDFAEFAPVFRLDGEKIIIRFKVLRARWD
jgi:hypothetical protein